MATLLKLGADVSGLDKIERLALGLEEVAIAAEHVDLASKQGSQQIKVLSASMNRLAADAQVAAAALRGQQNNLKQINGDGFNKASKAAKNFHDTLRGVSGAMGGLWLTYGSIIPMIAGFAAVSSTLKTVTSGSELDYTARNIEILSHTYETLSNNAELASKSLQGTREALLGIQDSVFSVGDLGNGVLEFSRAGFTDFEENLKGIAAASQFAYIGQMDLSKSIELVVGQLTAFNKEGLTADKAFNTMAVVADKTSVDLQQMSEAFKNVTSLGTVLGLEFGDVAVALGAMGQAGIRGATAGAALNTMMYKLIAPTKAAQEKMAALGISFNAFNEQTGKMKSIREISFELANMSKTLNLSTKEMGGVFEAMVGLRGVKALGALVNMAKESSDEFDDLTESVKNSSDYLESYFNFLEKSGKVQIDLLKADFDRLFAGAYTNAEPAVVEALKSLRDLVKDPALKGGVSAIVEGSMYLIKILADGTKFVVDFVDALDNIIPIKDPIIATLAGIANKVEQVTNLMKIYKEGSQGVVFSAPEDMWSYSDLNEASVAGAKKQAEELAEAAKQAKKQLVEINEVGVEVFSDEEASRLEQLQTYFDGIRDRINEVNSTPLQLVNAKVEKDISTMLAQLTQSGLTVDQMIDLTANYIEQLGDLGNTGETAASKIAGISDALAKAGNDKDKIKALMFNLNQLSTSLNQKEIEKANKEMIKNMRKDWQDYADKVIDIQDSLAQNQRTLASELRAIDQSNMVGIKLWRDKKKEVEEYKAAAIEASNKAKAAFVAGDKPTGESQYKLAEQYFKQATEAAKGLNVQVTADTSALNNQSDVYKNLLDKLKAIREQQQLQGKDTSYADAQITKYQRVYDYLSAEQQKASSTVIIPKLQGAEEAKTQLRDLYNTWASLQTQVQQSMKAAMDEIQKKADTAIGTPVDMTEGMEESKAKFINNWIEANKSVQEGTKESAKIMNDAWNDAWSNFLDSGSESIDYLEERLQALVRDRSISITATISSNSGYKAGGLIGGYQRGGIIQALASGGGVKNVLGGAYLPGFGGGDRRLLLGEDGEVMINKWSTKKGGVDTALAYNNSNFDTVVNNLVNRGLTSFNPNGNVDNENTHTVVWKFEDTGESARVKTTAVDLDIIQRGLKRRERLRS